MRRFRARCLLSATCASPGPPPFFSRAILLWPALGLGFPTGELSLARLWGTLFADPVVFGGEVSGGLVLALYAFRERLPTRLGLAAQEARSPTAPDPPKDDEP